MKARGYLLVETDAGRECVRQPVAPTMAEIKRALAAGALFAPEAEPEWRTRPTGNDWGNLMSLRRPLPRNRLALWTVDRKESSAYVSSAASRLLTAAASSDAHAATTSPHAVTSTDGE